MEKLLLLGLGGLGVWWFVNKDKSASKSSSNSNSSSSTDKDLEKSNLIFADSDGEAVVLLEERSPSMLLAKGSVDDKERFNYGKEIFVAKAKSNPNITFIILDQNLEEWDYPGSMGGPGYAYVARFNSDSKYDDKNKIIKKKIRSEYEDIKDEIDGKLLYLKDSIK